MGKVMSLANPFRNYNVEGRAHRIISQSKPVPAPKYKRDELDLERLMKEYPDVYQQSLQKNPQLNEHLKDVFVTSQKDNPIPAENPDRPLPANRKPVDYFEYGMKEPENIPEGKIVLRNALQFITDHQNDPKTNTANKIAEQYKIPVDTIKNILQYCKVFEIYIPQERNPKAKFAGPSIPKVKVIKQLRKQLGPGTEKGNT